LSDFSAERSIFSSAAAPLAAVPPAAPAAPFFAGGKY